MKNYDAKDASFNIGGQEIYGFVTSNHIDDRVALHLFNHYLIHFPLRVKSLCGIGTYSIL